jgi:hypothetical protein
VHNYRHVRNGFGGGHLEMRALEDVCGRGYGRKGLEPIRRLIEAAQMPEPTRMPLEDRVLALCRNYDLPTPATNVLVLGYEVDAFWPRQKLIVEADGWSFHRHWAAFERDRTRDAAMQAEGYRVIRLTHRRLEREPKTVAKELRRLLGSTDVPGLRPPYVCTTTGTSRGERGQGTVEWVGLVAVVALVMVGLVATGVRVPGAALARIVGARILCAVALVDRCGDEPVLIAAYGTEVGELVREHMPSLAFEEGSRALPVDFRRCRSSVCGDGSDRGLVERTDSGLPVTAFAHVVDCREAAHDPGTSGLGNLGRQLDQDAPAGVAAVEGASGDEESGAVADCSGDRAGSLYIQYWLYYADSATLRGVPLAGAAGYHRDDWESVQIRIGPDGAVHERASSHHGYNYARGPANVVSDAGVDSLRTIAEAVGVRPRNGWGPHQGLLRVSGGSHAGNASGFLNVDRIVLGQRVHLVPLEPIAAASAGYRFAVSPPWRKRVWQDPEAAETD